MSREAGVGSHAYRRRGGDRFDAAATAVGENFKDTPPAGFLINYVDASMPDRALVGLPNCRGGPSRDLAFLAVDFLFTRHDKNLVQGWRSDKLEHKWE